MRVLAVEPAPTLVFVMDDNDASLHTPERSRSELQQPKNRTLTSVLSRKGNTPRIGSRELRRYSAPVAIDPFCDGRTVFAAARRLDPYETIRI
jgi:hypothetical protein